MKLFTIGFTKTTAENFFTRIATAGVTRIADVRLNNVSQLAGFAKKTDLKYFAQAICGIAYTHIPSLAPEKSMLDEYKKSTHDWDTYESRFNSLIKDRRIDQTLSRDQLQGACLLCSEDKPHHCHRRLVAEYLRDAWGDVDIIHL
jgi:uncharacterized protein (DUF488 family)